LIPDNHLVDISINQSGLTAIGHKALYMERTTQDVTSFSGLGSWLSSFSPDGASTQDIHEVDGGGPYRLYQGETEVSRFELPGDDRHVGDVELPADGPSKKPGDDDSTKIQGEAHALTSLAPVCFLLC
jgi:hypothetical protein